MAPSPLAFFIFFPLFVQTVTSQPCQDYYLCGLDAQFIRFPFGPVGIRNRCSYPGFNLISCNDYQTILNLPNSGNFTVRLIDYQTQSIFIQDPEGCFPKHFLSSSFDLSGSPFFPEHNRTFAFLTCPSNFSSFIGPTSPRWVNCLSNDTHNVMAMHTDVYEEYEALLLQSCTLMSKTVSVPVSWPRWSDAHTRLLWNDPDCKSCEERGGICGFESVTGLDIGCYGQRRRNGLPRSAKYGIIIGIGIPGLLCIIGIGCYLCSRFRTYSRRHHPNIEFSTSISPQPVVVVAGLDGPTIESYPKTQLGESRRLPKPSDNTCSICLCEYQPKETLRTIPECSHYFHAECIDEWLKMNATCPLCRNSPDGSSHVTASSSSSTSSSSSSSSFLPTSLSTP